MPDSHTALPRKRAPRRSLAWGLAALLWAPVLAGCVGMADPRPTSTPLGTQSGPPPANKQQDLYLPVSTGSSALDLQGTLVQAVRTVSPAVVSIQTDLGLGSGVLYDPSGLLLTNAHVVSGASRVVIELADGRHFSGNVLGTDHGFDLAVVKIEAKDLPVARLGNSARLQAGQFVAAIGNPYGLDHTVTTGVVSAVNRPVSEGAGAYNQPMLQTDAAINPGNSGGPLVDLNGEVVGINTLVQAAPEGSPAQGLGFAVPINTAKRIVPQLVEHGRVTKTGQPFLGASIGDVAVMGGIYGSGGRRTPFGMSAPAGIEHGALVGDVIAKGPSHQAGIRAGDVIVLFDGHEVYGRDNLLRELVLHEPGDRVSVTVIRQQEPLDLALTIGEAPPVSD